MAHLDKTSVRDEVSQLKDDFEQLCSKGKINDEVRVLMKSLFMIIDLILSIFLERITQKDSKNSSKPSSQTDKDESSLSQPGSNGKGKHENRTVTHNTRAVTAHLDKTSVRDEVSQLKDDFEQLCSKGKINDEVRVLMKSLFMIIDLILSIFLERITQKDSKNSSKPSSQTDKDESSLSQPGSNGKGKHENRTVTHNTRAVETVALAKVDHCDVCGEDLHDTPCTGHERRTKMDIVFEKTVDHIDAEIKQCPTCDSRVKGTFPSDRHGPL